MLAQWGLYQTGTPSQQLAAANQIRFLQVLGWDITNPGSQLLSTDQQTYLASLENQNLTTGDFAGWHVASDINGSKQEFVFYEAPEPTSIILFGTGVVVLSFLRWRRRRTKK
jgi:hypothetical protein